MAKVNVRKETGKLVIDFTYRSVRCREQTALDDNVANRKRVEAVLKKLREAIAAGTFVYAEFFPGSALASRFEVQQQVADEVTLATSPKSAGSAAAAEVSTPSFRDFVAIWLSEHKIEWRRSHIKVLNSTLDGHLLPHFGNKPVGQISKSDVLTFRAALADKPGRLGEKLSNKRINNVVGALRQILADAADRYSFVSPCANLKPLKIRKSDVQPFSLDQVQTILSTVRADWKDYFTIRFLTGVRTGEAHGLKWKYVDFENRLILIRETFVLGEDEYTKTDSSQRDIQMSQPVFEALKRQFEATGKLSAYVFCNREGLPIDNKNFSDRVWYPLLRHLDLASRRPYQMRHTAATLWLASGEAPEWVARQLGHASTQMLFQVYSRFVPNMTRQDGSAIDRLLATRFASGNASNAANGSSGKPASDQSASIATNAQAPPVTFPKSDKVDHMKVTFKNRYGITLAGDLYLPKNAKGKLAAIAVSGPFGAVKEQSSGLYAQTMAERGFATLAFDPSYTGESGGEPRNVASPDINIEDFSAAVDFLGLQSIVDRERIGILGVCGWGGMALGAAAVDKRIKAVSAVTMYDMTRVMSKGYFDSTTPERRAKALEQLSQQRWADAEKGTPAYGPVSLELKGGEPKGMTPSIGDITYYAPWGNLAIFYRGFGHANGLIKLGHITGDMSVFRGPAR